MSESVETFEYKPGDWVHQPVNEGPNRGIRVGGGVNVCVFPVPWDERYMESYIKYNIAFRKRREEGMSPAIGEAALSD
jgi:hypothetical protein